MMTAMCMQRQGGVGGKAKWTDTERRVTSGSAGVTVGPRDKEILSLVKAASSTWNRRKKGGKQGKK